MTISAGTNNPKENVVIDEIDETERLFWLKNLEEAAKFWETVPPAKVVPDLSHYHCGSAHCFGGWLPSSPYFQGLGLSGSSTNVSLKNEQNPWTQVGFGAARILFGTSLMFEVRSHREEDELVEAGLIPNEEVSDHEFVAARIKARILELQSEEN